MPEACIGGLHTTDVLSRLVGKKLWRLMLQASKCHIFFVYLCSVVYV